ncbi:MAG: STN domain-containing protein [Zoogloea oleivorans]|jgi:iron complex outermembrane receptor protein|uniref:STN domain-containing protein n=1 Tax=Zoogloea oleivorans TaxID=1552750 RepID=UPI002A361EEC|nr:STN domain-containing protein [Zoogloea oleivorans]MDY0038599.1 STN domain-containing protein [Zoogloea oleivorans]
MLFAAHASRPTSFRLPAATLRPLALALAIALLSGAGFGINTAHAQAPAQVAYDIPAGPLGAVLNRFAQQSGSAISVDAASIQGLHSPGLKGRHDVEEGFRLLLQGSGHTIGRTPTGYVLVPLHSSEASEIQTLPAVKVSASALVGPDELPPVYSYCVT